MFGARVRRVWGRTGRRRSAARGRRWLRPVSCFATSAPKRPSPALLAPSTPTRATRLERPAAHQAPPAQHALSAQRHARRATQSGHITSAGNRPTRFTRHFPDLADKCSLTSGERRYNPRARNSEAAFVVQLSCLGRLRTLPTGPSPQSAIATVRQKKGQAVPAKKREGPHPQKQVGAIAEQPDIESGSVAAPPDGAPRR